MYLYFEDLVSLRRELFDYWLREVDEDIAKGNMKKYTELRGDGA
jgi:hypothetical protein